MTMPTYAIIYPVRKNTVKHIVVPSSAGPAEEGYRTLCGTIADVRLHADSPMFAIYRHCAECGRRHNA